MSPAPVRLLLFGSPAVANGDTRQALAFERRTQLAALLALRRDWVPRAEVAALLWPEQEGKLAFANLRKTLFRMPALRWTAALDPQGTALRFEVATDVHDFEQALADGRADDALALYRGELLAGFDDGQSEAWTRWLDFERERLRGAWRATALAALDAGTLEPAAALALAARLLESDPLDEAALRHQVEGLARAGQAAAARAAWRQFVERLRDDLGLEPGAALRALHDGLGGDAPAPAAPAPPPLPADDGFVGRAMELQRMGELLARDECRLLCLVGPGGVGKTRLARRAMQVLAPAVADAAVFVALEDAETAAQFGQRLAQAAGVTGAPQQRDPLAAAVEAWRTRRLLLVLDNFEQLTAQAPLLDQLLQQCPRLKLVVTSRLRLGLASEWSMPVEGLPWPDAEDGDRIEAFDAVRLFVRAARRVEPDFTAAGESVALVDICRQVAGLPLALELAAAWVRVLSCEEIARELRQGTELLRAADPAHPARHASIDTVFEQSWRRLGEAERQVLARLSVFHGGFTVETARAVAGASLPVLGALADKSLLARERLRMQLHPLVQQLAAQRLDEAGARAATEDAHAAFFQRWLQQLAPAAERGEREALQAIDTEFENGRRAWSVAAARGRAGALLSALPTLRHYVEDRARFEDGLAMMRETLHSRAGEVDAGLRACLLAGVARMQLRLARYAEAQGSAAAALDAAAGPAEREARYEAHSVLGGCALALGHTAEARQAYERALALAKARARAGEIGSTLDNLALCDKRLGHYERALALTQEALSQHRRHGDHARLAVCLNNLGSLCTFMDEDEAARTHLREALALSERHGHVSTRAFVLCNLVELALKSGDDDGAREHTERALGAAREAHLLTLQAWLQVQRGRLAARRGELDTARAALAEAAAQTLALDVQSVKPAVLLGFAELLEAQGRAGAARRLLAYAADEAALSVPDRDELRAAWARRAALGQADPPWPAIGLAELLQRIADEAPQAHAPLLDQLQEAA